jgi:hypothetical protein
LSVNAVDGFKSTTDTSLLIGLSDGGAIATELSHDALKVNPFLPIVLLWIGAFIRERSIFL